MASSMAGLTCPMRFPADNPQHFLNLANQLVPFPRMHFMQVCFLPVLPSLSPVLKWECRPPFVQFHVQLPAMTPSAVLGAAIHERGVLSLRWHFRPSSLYNIDVQFAIDDLSAIPVTSEEASRPMAPLQNAALAQPGTLPYVFSYAQALLQHNPEECCNRPAASPVTLVQVTEAPLLPSRLVHQHAFTAGELARELLLSPVVTSPAGLVLRGVGSLPSRSIMAASLVFRGGFKTQVRSLLRSLACILNCFVRNRICDILRMCTLRLSMKVSGVHYLATSAHYTQARLLTSLLACECTLQLSGAH